MQGDRDRERQRETKTETERARDRQRQTQSDRSTERDRETERQRDRDRQRDRQINRQTGRGAETDGGSDRKTAATFAAHSKVKRTVSRKTFQHMQSCMLSSLCQIHSCSCRPAILPIGQRGASVNGRSCEIHQAVTSATCGVKSNTSAFQRKYLSPT